MLMARRDSVLLSAAALGVTVAMCGSPSYAALVSWTLDGVKFADGGTATGWFVADSGSVVDWNIEATVYGYLGQSVTRKFVGPPLAPPCWPDGFCCPDYGYNDPVHVTCRPFQHVEMLAGAFAFLNEHPPSVHADALALEPETVLTDKGGTVLLVPGSYGRHSYLEVDGGFGPIPGVVAGALTGFPIPEPSESLLLALGFAALLGFSVQDKFAVVSALCEQRTTK